ncbi:amino acid permease-domain-containing protein [Scheffersomyces coipomensis]|uniref:amino acid permease-domain-containing protein n=1 Tax=Scheffersomyces coipomensis TaxID=1788519 RepID=UPI00315CA49E
MVEESSSSATTASPRGTRTTSSTSEPRSPPLPHIDPRSSFSTSNQVHQSPSYASHVFDEIGSSAPIKLLSSLLTDENADDDTEHVEHFKYKQDLQRKLTVTSVIGLGFSLMGVPFGLSSTLWISLMDGGNVTILYGWLVVGFFSFCVVLSLSEIISKYPTAGGVYHFSALLSNDKYSLICSWLTGWFLLIGNWTYAVSIMFAGSQFILSIFGLKDVYYKEDIFFVLGIFFIILSFCGFVNFRFSRYIEQINKACILWTIYTVLAIDVLLILFARKTNTVKDILTSFDNSRSGWPDPLAFMVGLQASAFTLTGYGMLFSITEEVKNPEKNMAKGAISAISISIITGIIFIIPLLTILPEMSLLLDNTPEIMPIDLVFKLATESYMISFLLVLLLVGTVLFQSIGSFTTASRTTYAFARDGGLPFKDYWVAVDSVDEYTIPKNALFLSMFVCAALSLLSLISTSAFNAFMGACVISLTLANGIPILCLMLNKRRKIRGAVFKLRKFGWIVNGLSVFWSILSAFILCLPPVIKDLNWITMNYASAVFILFAGVAVVGYKWWGVGSFEGPKIDTEYFELNNLESQQRRNIQDEFMVVDDTVAADEDFEIGDDYDEDEEEEEEEEEEEGQEEEEEEYEQGHIQSHGKFDSKYKKIDNSSYDNMTENDGATLVTNNTTHFTSPPSTVFENESSSDVNELSTGSETEVLFDATMTDYEDNEESHKDQ